MKSLRVHRCQTSNQSLDRKGGGSYSFQLCQRFFRHLTVTQKLFKHLVNTTCIRRSGLLFIILCAFTWIGILFGNIKIFRFRIT